MAEDEEEHSPAVRVSMCQGGPGARCAGVFLPVLMMVFPILIQTGPMFVEGSVASGDEEVEVPVGGASATVSCSEGRIRSS